MSLGMENSCYCRDFSEQKLSLCVLESYPRRPVRRRESVTRNSAAEDRSLCAGSSMLQWAHMLHSQTYTENCLRNLTPLPVHPLELFALSSGPTNFWQLYQRTYKQIVAFLEWWHKKWFIDLFNVRYLSIQAVIIMLQSGSFLLSLGYVFSSPFRYQNLMFIFTLLAGKPAFAPLFLGSMISSFSETKSSELSSKAAMVFCMPSYGWKH